MLANVDSYEGDSADQDRDAACLDAPVCPRCDEVLDSYRCCPVCWNSTEGSVR